MVSKGQYFGFFFCCLSQQANPNYKTSESIEPIFPGPLMHSSPSMLLLVQTEGWERKGKGNIPVAMLNIIL